MRKNKVVLTFCLIFLFYFVMGFNNFIFAAVEIKVIWGEYEGIQQEPSLADIYGDGSKKMVYMDTDNYLFARDSNGVDVVGWPYMFPVDEWGTGNTAIYDIDNDGKDEIVVNGGMNDMSGLFVKILKHSDIGPIEIGHLPINVDYEDFFNYEPQSFWESKIAVGNLDSDSDPEIITYQKAIKLNGTQKSITENLVPGNTVFVIGTPMIIEDNGKPFVVFHAAEVPDLSVPYYYTRAIYCIEINWDSPNNILWRISLGTIDGRQYKSYNYKYYAWGELGAADIDNNGHIEVVATAGIGSIFEYRVIDINGQVLNSMNNAMGSNELGSGFWGEYDLHTRFAIADFDCGRKVIFFPHYSSGNFWVSPESQPACADIDADGIIDFLIRATYGKKIDNSWKGQYCFMKISPHFDVCEESMYEPIVFIPNEDNIDQIFNTGPNLSTTYYASYLWHVVTADMNNNGYFSLIGVRADGSGLDVVNFDTQSFIPIDWRQAYGNSKRTNFYRDSNRAPLLESIGDKEVDENGLLIFSVTAIDPDGDELRYYAENLPDGSAFEDQIFTWIPLHEQIGEYYVTFKASDGILTDEETIKITVNPPNYAPELAPIGNKSVYVGRVLKFKVTATDTDGDSLTYTAKWLPKRATFSNQIFTWRPMPNQVGTYRVTFKVSDGALVDSETITITVKRRISKKQ